MSMNHRSSKKSKNRSRGFELLEGRCLLSISTADYRPTRQFSETPFDAPLVLSEPEANYLDPNGPLPDTLASPDTLGLYDVRIRAQATDAAGNPLTQINVGDRFFLRVYVQDARPEGTGVFGAYADVSYRSDLAKATGPIAFADANGKEGWLSPGRIADAGAFRGMMVGDTAVRLLFTVPMQAKAVGSLSFVPSAPQSPHANAALLYGIDTSIPPSRIDYQSTQMTILPSPPGAEANTGADDPGYTTSPPAPMYAGVKAEPPTAVPREHPAVALTIPATKNNGEVAQVNDLRPVTIQSVPPLYDPSGLEYLFAEYPKSLLEIRIEDEMGRLVAIKLTALNMIFDAEAWALLNSIKFSVTGDVADTQAIGSSGQDSDTLQVNRPDIVDSFGIELAVSTDHSVVEQPDRGLLAYSGPAEGNPRPEDTAPHQVG